ncbi:MAG: nitroreductase family protein [Candidatus Omnitrophica bacterium]|nr:nitroreductase family protein [Candidatus Omnitrophota bacterium]MDD5429178.1 nitroreductase family protein [Candidatus Omnitrophota bacterium]
MKHQLHNLIISRRSIRLFKQKKIPLGIIKKAVNAGRLAPSAANLQFLEYLAVNKPQLCEKIFSFTRWAGYLYPRRMPPEGKKPVAYIFILINKAKTKQPDSRDIGASAENIILSLLSQGIGACWIASLDKEALIKILKIPKNYQIDSIIACGYPAENPKLETGSKKIKYWLDAKGRLHVPKRPLKNILYLNKMK